MGREEIGDYLGMKIETVSRILAKLNLAKIIEIKSKELKILNIQELQRLAGSEWIPTKSTENHIQLVNMAAPVDSYKLKQGFEEA
jgi:CRP/FNR family transcriptional regulator